MNLSCSRGQIQSGEYVVYVFLHLSNRHLIRICWNTFYIELYQFMFFYEAGQFSLCKTHFPCCMLLTPVVISSVWLQEKDKNIELQIKQEASEEFNNCFNDQMLFTTSGSWQTTTNTYIYKNILLYFYSLMVTLVWSWGAVGENLHTQRNSWESEQKAGTDLS